MGKPGEKGRLGGAEDAEGSRNPGLAVEIGTRARLDLDPDGDLSPFRYVADPKQRAFLIAFAETGIVARSAERAGIHPTTPYCPSWKANEQFQSAWAVAQEMAASGLEDEARRRAVDGVKRYRFNSKTGAVLRHPDLCVCGEDLDAHEGGPPDGCRGFKAAPYYEHEYSDNLMSQLLKAHVPRFKDSLEIKALLANVDYSTLPNDALRRMRDGENPVQVLAGLLKAGTPPAE